MRNNMELKTIIGLSLIFLSLLLIFICLLKKKNTFFNTRKILMEHIGLFKTCPFQYVIFYGLPLLFAVGLAMVYEAGISFYSELGVILGIILSMLFAILSILSGHDFSSVSDDGQKSKVKKVLKQTINAIIFDSILSLFLMLYGLVFIVINGNKAITGFFDKVIISQIVSGIAYYIFVVILLNLLLILKYMSKIIEFNLEVKKGGEK